MSSFRIASPVPRLECTIRPKQGYWQTAVSTGRKRSRIRVSVSMSVCHSRREVWVSLPAIRAGVYEASRMLHVNHIMSPAARRVYSLPWPTVELNGHQARVFPCSLNHFIVTEV